MVTADDLRKAKQRWHEIGRLWPSGHPHYRREWFLDGVWWAVFQQRKGSPRRLMWSRSIEGRRDQKELAPCAVAYLARVKLSKIGKKEGE